jgi:hypothetical protein
MSELPEIRQVFTDLRIGQIQAFAKLLRGDRPAVLTAERFELPQVKAEPTDGGIGDRLRSMVHATPDTRSGGGLF